MVFHFCHNALTLVNSRITPSIFPDGAMLRAFALPGEEAGCMFTWRAILVGSLAAFLLLAWFRRLSGAKPREETLPLVVVARLKSDAVQPALVGVRSE